MQYDLRALFFGLSICQLWQSVFSEQLVYSIVKTVDAETYKYIEVESDGNYRVELHSLVGDADLYISDVSKRPTYEDFELKSATCGPDIVHIPYTFSRPVNIGVYGHYSYEQTTFSLQVYYEEFTEDDYFVDSYFFDETDTSDNKQGKGQTKSGSGSPGKRPSIPKGEEEESLLWTIFISILKIFFEILV